MKEFWDNRYSTKAYAYGVEASVYVKKILPSLPTGKILFPAEGEGRNAVYAAQLGWNVSAFDFSSKAKEKALELAKSRNVDIEYDIYSFMEEAYDKESFDAVCMSSVHFNPSIKAKMQKRLDGYVKIGRYFIIDAFSKEHREINKKNPAAGGPPNADMMYSIEEIKEAFAHYEFVELTKELITLDEGFGHVGESSLIRFVGKKLRHRE